MEDTKQRLKDTAEACLKAYDIWENSKKNAAAREELQEAVHELRKVSARLEIEMAASERDETNQRQIPIPPHRASRNRQPDNIGNELPDFITADSQSQGADHENVPPPAPRAPRPPMGGGQRRPQGGTLRSGRPQQQSSSGPSPQQAAPAATSGESSE